MIWHVNTIGRNKSIRYGMLLRLPTLVEQIYQILHVGDSSRIFHMISPFTLHYYQLKSIMHTLLHAPAKQFTKEYSNHSHACAIQN